MTEQEPAGAGVDEGAEGEEREPEIRASDRFTINGKPLPFGEFVSATMSQMPWREPTALEPQPEPEPWDVIWLSRVPAGEEPAEA